MVGYSSPERDVALLQGEVDGGSMSSATIQQNPSLNGKGALSYHHHRAQGSIHSTLHAGHGLKSIALPRVRRTIGC